MITENAINRQISANIRRLRTEHPVTRRKVTQSELSQQIGITRATLTNIEVGNQRPPIHIIYRICDYFSVELSEVLPSVDSLIGSEFSMKISVGGESQEVPPMMYKLISIALSEDD